MPPRLLAPPSFVRDVFKREDLMTLLEPWIPGATDREFVVRCILDEGPIHHRGSSYVLLRLLGLALAAVGGAGPQRGESAPISLRLPPHLRRDDDDDQRFPIGVPLAALARIAPRDSPAFGALLDCLRDGPPHHALANAAMVCVLGALLDRLTGETAA